MFFGSQLFEINSLRVFSAKFVLRFLFPCPLWEVSCIGVISGVFNTRPSKGITLVCVEIRLEEGEKFRKRLVVRHISKYITVFGPPNSQSLASERVLVQCVWNLRFDVWRSLCEISCSHFRWKLKDINPPPKKTKNSPHFSSVFSD